MVVSELLHFAKTELVDIDSSTLDAELLLAFVMKISREKLFMYPNKKISANLTKIYKKFIQKRKQRIPIAYLLKKKEFYGLEFFVDERVLVPRPETEILVGEIIAFVSNYAKKTFNIIDVGTGSGCIAITLARNTSNTKIFALDISEKALEVARLNKKKIAPNAEIRFQKSDFLESVKDKNPENLIIVSNPPYGIKYDAKDPEVDYEPNQAFYAEEEGLLPYKKILKQSKEMKVAALFFEIDSRRKEQILNIVKTLYPNKKFEIINDLSGKERVLKII